MTINADDQVFARMNPTALLQDTQHRDWPLPTRPWVMTQIWHELLFAHWPLHPEQLRPLIPSALRIDTFERQAWVGIVPFRMSHVRPRGIPAINGLSQFPELNVRTYVSVNGIPGVYFFSLDAGNPVAVALARTLFHLPYFNARMRCQAIGVEDHISYSSKRTHPHAAPAEFVATYAPVAPATYAGRGTLAHWLTERYALYTLVGQHIYRGDIHHPQWALQAAELQLTCNTMAQAHHILLPDTEPLLHYAHRQEVLIWPLRRVA
jgi:uncharacterized protein YqjF (DUF2071 family)